MLAGLGCARGSPLSPQQAGGPGSRQGAGKGRSAVGPCHLGGTGRACKDKGDRTGARLPWPCCSVSTGDWKWESSELWWRLCGEGAGTSPGGMGGVSRGLYSAHVRSLPLQLSQILVSLAEGRVLPEASPRGLGDVPAFSPHPWWLWQ